MLPVPDVIREPHALFNLASHVGLLVNSHVMNEESAREIVDSVEA